MERITENQDGFNYEHDILGWTEDHQVRLEDSQRLLPDDTLLSRDRLEVTFEYGRRSRAIRRLEDFHSDTSFGSEVLTEWTYAPDGSPARETNSLGGSRETVYEGPNLIEEVIKEGDWNPSPDPDLIRLFDWSGAQLSSTTYWVAASVGPLGFYRPPLVAEEHHSYDPRGRLARVTSDTHTTWYAYDDDDRMLERSTAFSPEVSEAEIWEFDEAGRLTRYASEYWQPARSSVDGMEVTYTGCSSP